MGNANRDRNVLIVGETIDGRLSAGTRDLAGQARTLAQWFDADPIGVLTGHDAEPVARQWSTTNRIPVIYLDHARCRHPNPCMTAAGIEPLVRESPPTAVCFPNSMRACQIAATLAWRLKAPCITAVESIAKAGDNFRFKRSVLGGRLWQTVATDARPILLTLLPGIFSGSSPPTLPDRSPRVTVRHLTHTDRRFTPLTVQRPSEKGRDLVNARVIVAAGRGLGGPEYAVLLHEVAGIFKNASVGSSRGACDLGWLPHSRQIG
ncbi:MAG: FAD-binding protein, partial [Desulfosarcina sp.]